MTLTPEEENVILEYRNLGPQKSPKKPRPIYRVTFPKPLTITLCCVLGLSFAIFWISKIPRHEHSWSFTEADIYEYNWRDDYGCGWYGLSHPDQDHRHQNFKYTKVCDICGKPKHGSITIATPLETHAPITEYERQLLLGKMKRIY